MKRRTLRGAGVLLPLLALTTLLISGLVPAANAERQDARGESFYSQWDAPLDPVDGCPTCIWRSLIWRAR